MSNSLVTGQRDLRPPEVAEPGGEHIILIFSFQTVCFGSSSKSSGRIKSAKVK